MLNLDNPASSIARGGSPTTTEENAQVRKQVPRVDNSGIYYSHTRQDVCGQQHIKIPSTVCKEKEEKMPWREGHSSPLLHPD